jgi:hypothetical protein
MIFNKLHRINFTLTLIITVFNNFMPTERVQSYIASICHDKMTENCQFKRHGASSVGSVAWTKVWGVTKDYAERKTIRKNPE